MLYTIYDGLRFMKQTLGGLLHLTAGSYGGYITYNQHNTCVKVVFTLDTPITVLCGVSALN